MADIELSNGICVSVDSDSRFTVQWALEDRADLVSCAGCGHLHAVAERVDCECGAVILSPAAFYGVADR